MKARIVNEIARFCFQTVSGRVMPRNSATFNAKVGHFLSVNHRVIYVKGMDPVRAAYRNILMKALCNVGNLV